MKSDQEIRDSYEQQGLTPPENPDTGEIVAHTEWNGWLYCERTGEPFDWQTGDVECPHCGDTFEIPEPRGSGE